MPERVEDDRVLVESLQAVRIVDDAGKIVTDESIDSLEGVHYDFDEADSLVYKSAICAIVHGHLGRPITLRSVNELSRDIIKKYRDCKQPIVDVVIPEQRITSGTLHLVVTESRIGKVKVQPGCYFDFESTAKWIESTRPGCRIYEPNIEDDLFWLNQNTFRRVTVDFDKGEADGSTDVTYKMRDVVPIRGYVGIDDSGVETLNFGRFFAGAQYGNVLGRGGTLGYQYTTDEQFQLLHAHSLSYNQPFNRDWSFNGFGSYATVQPKLSQGLLQDGSSYQLGSTLSRHLIRNRTRQQNFNFGYDFKSTDNSLEFDGTTISGSTADLFQLRFGIDDYVRHDIDQFASFRFDTFIGPGGGMSGSHSAAAFNTIRPGTSPDYIYARMNYARADLLSGRWLLSSKFTGQVASERLLFSETLGLGGFDTIRGTDQRSYNADHGWIANFEFGPKTYRFGCEQDARTFRAYTFMDMGNGYIADPLEGEDASTFALSTGVGCRYQISDRFIARFDYGFGIEDIDGVGRNDRAHFGLTWIPGPRP
ncbi:Heme/hemopexin transporter protein HuxB precursor [Rubripirellula tenax]|uniref:Heme/hemopexin transporter protein HuxB n=1 Tax=Rubripirellula tenax TaxID=2528015 RepID=A0A5C6FIY7_9BACT|nr:ShlB/FhaC/HecB family hemolysin secretion/activation protein [Rubripirellula tenax]TWU60019.1 Heme/hemopexin transporter protein HuxB precursor [Rubripirellula tenax]